MVNKGKSKLRAKIEETKNYISATYADDTTLRTLLEEVDEARRQENPDQENRTAREPEAGPSDPEPELVWQYGKLLRIDSPHYYNWDSMVRRDALKRPRDTD
jgi:hypothetical protein